MKTVQDAGLEINFDGTVGVVNIEESTTVETKTVHIDTSTTTSTTFVEMKTVDLGSAVVALHVETEGKSCLSCI